MSDDDVTPPPRAPVAICLESVARVADITAMGCGDLVVAFACGGAIVSVRLDDAGVVTLMHGMETAYARRVESHGERRRK